MFAVHSQSANLGRNLPATLAQMTLYCPAKPYARAPFPSHITGMRNVLEIALAE